MSRGEPDGVVVRRVASLGMYDMPVLAWANDAVWGGLRDRLRARGIPGVPDAIDRASAVERIWHDPRLLLAQTCGYPLVTSLAEVVRLVMTPGYDLPGCRGFWHRSFIVARAQDRHNDLGKMRGRRCAMNSPASNTGMNLLRAAVAPLAHGQPFFSSVIETGAHVESLRAVREGRADVAAIDCVTHGLLARHAPQLLDNTSVIGETPCSPALPFVTAYVTTDADVEALQAALRETLADPTLAEARRALAWSRVEALTWDDYTVVADLEAEAARIGYPALV